MAIRVNPLIKLYIFVSQLRIVMEFNNDKNSVYKYAANYGLILGLATVIYSLLMRFAGFADSSMTFWGYQIIISVAIAFGIKKYKEEIEEGFISYAKALKIGVLIAAFSGVIQAFFVYFYYSFTSPEEMTAIVNNMQEILVQMGKSDQEIEMASKMLSPTYFAVVIMIKEILKGFIFSLIISAFLKKEKSIFED